MTPAGLLNTVIELPAEADAYIASEWPDQSFGMDALYLGYNLAAESSFGAERILVRFDIVNNVPEGAVVNDARLRLRLNFSSPGDDEPMGTILRRSSSDWREMDVTWNREPEWGEIRAESDVGSALAWYEWDVAALVGDWVAGTHVNHGMEIIGDERVQQRERAFYSRETTNEFYPRLVIDYTDFQDTEPPIVTVNDLPPFVGRDFTVSWSGKDPGGSGIASYDVQYRVNGGDWEDWITGATLSSAVFAAGRDGGFYEFRARAEDRAGNVEPFGPPEASTTVDAKPPTTVMDPLPTITGSTSFTVSWTGYDEGTGIHHYDVQYRFNQGDWNLRYPQTLATSALFSAVHGDGIYDFEARAVDQFGLQESFVDQPEASVIVDAEPPFVVPRIWLPLIVHGN
jgi:hypothetical protein